MASSLAQIAKDKGNAAFKSGNWADAIGHYSAAVVADRKNPTYPLNRAAAYLKLGKHHDAERDCTTVLGIDAKNVKALFRRAQARMALDLLPEAEKDLREAMKIEPANVSVKTELAAIQKRRLEASQPSKREPITVSSASPRPRSELTSKLEPGDPPHQIIRNVPITIVEPDELASNIQSPSFLRPIHSRTLSSSLPSHLTTPATPEQKLQPRVGAVIFRADGSHTILRSPTSEATLPLASTPQTSAQSPRSNITGSSLSAAAVASNTHAFTTPDTHFAFTRAWNALSTSQERYSLLTRIPPDSLPTLFQNSLEPEFIMSILRAFQAVASPITNDILSKYMIAMPSVPRFNTVVLFLSPKEKDVVRGVFDAIGMTDEARRTWGM